ncbi:class I SAM-dependent methyltransferase [Sphingomicrobium nitratireducens]|uniref:class I SAM-dependent methyltransferase n=1 Tax=Sphingomicrobium nitratireducens TaxID=2964666 RepID=UPI00223F0989|nr:class I SAM-dependent methyltransferase [Sphingomicrobium nitratireducens]
MTTAASSGHWKAADYAGAGAFVPALGAPVVDLLAPQPGERILDVGCGDGALTIRLVEAGADVIGVDPNAELLAVAAERGITTHLAHAEAMTFSDEFDAAFSNAALHWIGAHRDLVATRIHAALKPGGRFVGEMGGAGNIAGLLGALEVEAKARGYEGEGASNWYPSPPEFSDVYARAGFADIEAELIDRPTPLGEEGVAGWIRTFRSGWLDRLGMPEDERDDYAAAVADRWGQDTADYKRLRFTMRKPN